MSLRPPEKFETDRLTARPVRVTDAPAMFGCYANDPVATRYLSWKAYDEVEPLTEFLKGREAVWESGEGHFAYVLLLRDTETLIGSIGLNVEAGKACFGYVLGQAYWGRGYTAEALRWLVDWALAQPEIFRAWAFCDAQNPASARVMEKAGMVREGVLRRWHVCPTIGPELRDCIVCAKVR